MKSKETPKDGISKAIDVLIDSGVDLSTLFDQGGLLKQLSKRLIEKSLESEMDNHLGYNKLYWPEFFGHIFLTFLSYFFPFSRLPFLNG